VLLDDEPVVLEATGETLGRHFQQATILKFTDPLLALHEILRTPPDLFLTDINHPILTCEDLLRSLAANHAKFPILVISGHAESRRKLAQITQALDLDITFIAKPWLRAEFIRQVTIHLSTNKNPITALIKFFNKTFHLPIAKYKDQAKTIAWGLLAVAAAIWFWFSIEGNPIHELALIRESKIVTGSIIHTAENETDTDVYSYRLPDRREFIASTSGDGKLIDKLPELTEPDPIEIEYLADNPEVSRIKGTGCQSVFEWL
jgi:CheY-like chemotaxis protein